MATFTQTNNPTPTFGEESQSVLELQKQLNAQGANLAEDSKFGPKTQAAADAANQSKIDQANTKRNNTVVSQDLNTNTQETVLPNAQPEVKSP